MEFARANVTHCGVHPYSRAKHTPLLVYGEREPYTEILLTLPARVCFSIPQPHGRTTFGDRPGVGAFALWLLVNPLSPDVRVLDHKLEHTNTLCDVAFLCIHTTPVSSRY